MLEKQMAEAFRNWLLNPDSDQISQEEALAQGAKSVVLPRTLVEAMRRRGNPFLKKGESAKNQGEGLNYSFMYRSLRPGELSRKTKAELEKQRKKKLGF